MGIVCNVLHYNLHNLQSTNCKPLTWSNMIRCLWKWPCFTQLVKAGKFHVFTYSTKMHNVYVILWSLKTNLCIYPGFIKSVCTYGFVQLGMMCHFFLHEIFLKDQCALNTLHIHFQCFLLLWLSWARTSVFSEAIWCPLATNVAQCRRESITYVND